MTSETFHYKRGANQQFCQMTHIFDPSKYTEEELLYDVDREIIPIAIHCVAEEGAEEMRQSHTTIATAEKLSDGTYVLKALKQKLFVDGLCYLLQEIYGIENKNNDKQSADDETEDNGSECVICMCDVRDTLILPCRHLCLCNSCADSLRYQANNCPICRAPFRALLQIRALQKCANPNMAQINPPDGSCDNIPPGYEAVSLIEALNGPCIPRQPPSAMPDLVETPDSEHAIQAAQILNRSTDRTPLKGKGSDPTTPEYGVLMTARGEEDNKETPKCPLLSDQKETTSPRTKHRPRDAVKHINEKSDKDENGDEDSEAEKLSPLLQNNENVRSGNLALNMADVVEPIDDTDTDHEEISSRPTSDKNKSYRSNGEERGDESDYYTPEEPAPTPGPLYESTGATSSVESTPQRLPGTPMSHASARSSGDSYTSGSSTRHLLAVVAHNGLNEKAVHI
jgi:hypothetical protein